MMALNARTSFVPGRYSLDATPVPDAGLERLLIASDIASDESVVDVMVAPIGEGAQDHALVLGRDFRRADMRCEVDTRGASMKALLRRANSLKARVAVIIGDSELAEGVVVVKDLNAQTQEKVARNDAVNAVKKVLG